MRKPTLKRPRVAMRVWGPDTECKLVPRRLECVSKARAEARSYQDGYLAGHADAWNVTGGAK